MHFHAARLAARLDATGGLLLLEEQDRSRWDREGIAARRGVAGAGRQRRRVLAIPRRGRHRRRALLRPVVRRDALEGDRRSLCDARAHRPVAAAHAEPGRRRRRVARARRPGSPCCRASRRPPGWRAPTSGTPCWPTCTGEPVILRSRSTTGSGRWPRRRRKPCATFSGAVCAQTHASSGDLWSATFDGDAARLPAALRFSRAFPDWARGIRPAGIRPSLEQWRRHGGDTLLPLTLPPRPTSGGTPSVCWKPIRLTTG